MGSFSWTHLILAVLIIVFAYIGNITLVIILAAILAILSIFGIFSYSTCKPKTVKKAAPKKKVKKRK